MAKIAIVDSQFQTGRANSLLGDLPDNIRKAVLRITEDNIQAFLKDRMSNIGLILVHASGVDGLDVTLDRLVELYNGNDKRRMGSDGGVPIIVTSGDRRNLLGQRARRYEAWDRSDWLAQAKRASTVERLIEIARICYSGSIDLLDAHLVCRTLFALCWQLAHRDEVFPADAQPPILGRDECLKHIERLAGKQYVGLKQYAERCLGRSDICSLQVQKAIQAIGSRTRLDSDAKDLSDAIDCLNNLMAEFAKVIQSRESRTETGDSKDAL